MLVEARVLGREHRQLHVRGQRRDRDDRAPLGEDLREERPVPREDARDLGRVVGAKIGDPREAGLEVPDGQPERQGGNGGANRRGRGGALEPFLPERGRRRGKQT